MEVMGMTWDEYIMLIYYILLPALIVLLTLYFDISNIIAKVCLCLIIILFFIVYILPYYICSNPDSSDCGLFLFVIIYRCLFIPVCIAF